MKILSRVRSIIIIFMVLPINCKHFSDSNKRLQGSIDTAINTIPPSVEGLELEEEEWGDYNPLEIGEILKGIPPPKTQEEVDADTSIKCIKNVWIGSEAQKFQYFDSSFFNCFIDEFKAKGKPIISIDSIKSLVDRLENEYLHYRSNSTYQNLEEILYNSTQYQLARGENLKFRYRMKIPESIKLYLDSADRSWLTKDTNSFQFYFNKATLEFLHVINSHRYEAKEKLNSLIVFGYYSFIRYQDTSAIQLINSHFFPRTKRNNIGPIPYLHYNNYYHAAYHILAKYNANLTMLKNDLYNYGLKCGYLFYKKALETPMEKCYVSAGHDCHAREEFLKMLMYQETDIETRKKALQTVTNFFNYTLDNRWLSLRSEFAMQIRSFYEDNYPAQADSVRLYVSIAANSVLKTMQYPNELPKEDLSILYQVIAGIFTKLNRDSDALYYNYLSHQKALDRSSYERETSNYGLTILNIPYYLYRVGRKKEALELYDYLMKKKFCASYFFYNLQMRCDLLANDKEYSQAKAINRRLLDSAIRQNNQAYKFEVYNNFQMIASLRQNRLAMDYYYLKSGKYYYPNYTSNPYFVGETNAIDATLEMIQFGDEIADMMDEIESAEYHIQDQYSEIAKIQKDKSSLNLELKHSKEKLALMKDSLFKEKRSLLIMANEIQLSRDTIIAYRKQKSQLAEDIEILDSTLGKMQQEFGTTKDLLTRQTVLTWGVFVFLLLAIIAFIIALVLRGRALYEAAKNKYLSSVTYLSNHFIKNIIACVNSFNHNSKPSEGRMLLYEFTSLNKRILKPLTSLKTTIQDEIELIIQFLDIHKKISQNFTYSIQYPDNWATFKHIGFPYGLLQLFCENSLLHGLYYRPADFQKHILIDLNCHDGQLSLSVKDNGVGRVAARLRNNNPDKESYGTTIAQSKVDGFNGFKRTDFNFEYIDPPDEGTIVIINSTRHETENPDSDS